MLIPLLLMTGVIGGKTASEEFISSLGFQVVSARSLWCHNHLCNSPTWNHMPSIVELSEEWAAGALCTFRSYAGRSMLHYMLQLWGTCRSSGGKSSPVWWLRAGGGCHLPCWEACLQLSWVHPELTSAYSAMSGRYFFTAKLQYYFS